MLNEPNEYALQSSDLTNKNIKEEEQRKRTYLEATEGEGGQGVAEGRRGRRVGGEKKKKKKGIRKSGCWAKEKGESDHCVPSDYYCHSNNEKLDEGSTNGQKK